jgi:hypothetical protein
MHLDEQAGMVCYARCGAGVFSVRTASGRLVVCIISALG